MSAEAPPAPAANPPALLELDKVRTFYGRIEAVKGLDHRQRGRDRDLIGANGAGKSTTLRSIQGLTKAKAGTIRFAGKEIQNAPPHEIVQMGIAHSPEGRRLFPRMSVRENLRWGVQPHRPGWHRAGHRARLSLSRASASGAASRRGRLGRRAADVLDRPCADVAARCCCSTSRRWAWRRSWSTRSSRSSRDQPRGHYHPAGGAERADRPRHRQPRLRARDRKVTLSDRAEALATNDEVRKAYLGIS